MREQMERKWTELVKFQDHYTKIKRRGDEVLKSLTETLDWYEKLEGPDKLNLLNRKQDQNTIKFLFCGIPVYVEIKYNSTIGFIIGGVITADKSQEIKNEYHRFMFDIHGNIQNTEQNLSFGLTGDFGYAFIFQLSEIIKAHLGKFDEVSI